MNKIVGQTSRGYMQISMVIDRPSGSGVEDFIKIFIPYMGVAAILVKRIKQFVKYLANLS